MTKRVLALFDVDGTLTVARKVRVWAARRASLIRGARISQSYPNARSADD